MVMMTANFGIKFEGGQLPIPASLQHVDNLRWDEVEFVSFDSHPSFIVPNKWVELCVTEANELYRYAHTYDITLSEEGVSSKEKSVDLFKLDSYTGEVNFGAYIPVENSENDYTVSFKATFHNGKFEKAEELSISPVSNKRRVNAMENLNRVVSKKIRLLNNPLYKWVYLPYKVVVLAIASLVNIIWTIPLKIFNFVVRLLCPL